MEEKCNLTKKEFLKVFVTPSLKKIIWFKKKINRFKKIELVWKK